MSAVQRYSKVYHRRLGKYRYILVYPTFAGISGLRQCMVFTGETINGKLYGEYCGLKDEQINGTLLNIEEIPESILEIIIKDIRHVGYL